MLLNEPNFNFERSYNFTPYETGYRDLHKYFSLLPTVELEEADPQLFIWLPDSHCPLFKKKKVLTDDRIQCVLSLLTCKCICPGKM